MSRLIVQRPSHKGLQLRVAQRLDTTAARRVASAAGGPARHPGATLPGPSRRITVEPLTVPLPAPYIPTPAPLEVEPSGEPQPVRDPLPTP
jgi:hypothetical protein